MLTVTVSPKAWSRRSRIIRRASASASCIWSAHAARDRGRVGLTESNIFQGELTFDQLLFNRPVPGYAQYRSPIGEALYVRLVHPTRAAV